MGMLTTYFNFGGKSLVELLSNYPIISGALVLIVAIIYLSLGLFDAKLTKQDGSVRDIDTFSTSRQQSIEEYYQRFFAGQGVPFYLVEGVWQVFFDAFINYTYLAKFILFPRTFSQPTITSGDDFLKPEFTWDFDARHDFNPEILIALESRFNVRITSQEASGVRTFKDIVDFIKPKLKPPHIILVSCPGDPSRSVLAGMLINYLGKGRFRALYAGGQPTGKVNPLVLAALKEKRIPNIGYQCQAWDDSVKTPIDLAIMSNSFEKFPVSVRDYLFPIVFFRCLNR